MGSTKQEKQEFLYSQIIEGGFDPDNFQEFMARRRENGLDIDTWDLTELKQIVHDYKLSQAESPSEEQVPTVEKGQKTTTNPNTSTSPTRLSCVAGATLPFVSNLPTKKVDSTKEDPAQEMQGVEPKVTPGKGQPFISKKASIQADVPGSEQMFCKTIKCQQTEPSELMTKDVSVFIYKFQKVEGGFFEQSYILYKVEVVGLGVTVGRRYSDFEWLREQLERRHPGYPVPPIGKKGAFRKYDQEYLTQRMNVFQNFINKMLTIPELKAEPIVFDFLSIQDPVKYAKSKKQKEIKDDKTKLEKWTTISGEVNMVIDPEITRYMSLADKNMNLIQPKLQKIYKDWKALSANMDQSASILRGISQSFESLKQDFSVFNSCLQNQKSNQYESLYSTLEVITKQWSDIFVQQAKTVYNQLYNTYKYEYINLESLSQSIKKVNSANNQYKDSKAKIQKTRQKLYDDRNFSRMDLPSSVFDKVSKDREAVPKAELLLMMLPKDVDACQKLKETYALVNFQCYQQLKRHHLKNPRSLSDSLWQFGNLQAQCASTSMMLWGDVMSKTMGQKHNSM